MRGRIATHGKNKLHWELLGYNDAPETRELLLKQLRQSDEADQITAAYNGATRLFGTDLSVSYALLASTYPSLPQVNWYRNAGSAFKTHM